MKRYLTIGMMALLLLTGNVFGQYGKYDNDGPHGKRMGGTHHEFGQKMRGHGQFGDGIGNITMMAEKLGLSSEQIEKLESMQTEFRLEMVDSQAKLKKSRINLRALRRDDASEAKIFAAIDEATELKAELQKMKFRHHSQMKATLTEEQQEKMKELRFQKGKHQGRRGSGDRGQGPRGR